MLHIWFKDTGGFHVIIMINRIANGMIFRTITCTDRSLKSTDLSFKSNL
jgi:hypothetical protein